MGIPEPEQAIEADFSKVDLVLVPLCAADKMGNRIGYGGGFYDRLLSNSNTMKVGLSLSPLLDKIESLDSWGLKIECNTHSLWH